MTNSVYFSKVKVLRIIRGNSEKYDMRRQDIACYFGERQNRNL